MPKIVKGLQDQSKKLNNNPNLALKKILNVTIAVNMGILLENVEAEGVLGLEVDQEEIDAEEQDREVEGVEGGDLELLVLGLDQDRIVQIQGLEREELPQQEGQ